LIWTLQKLHPFQVTELQLFSEDHFYKDHHSEQRSFTHLVISVLGRLQSVISLTFKLQTSRDLGFNEKQDLKDFFLKFTLGQAVAHIILLQCFLLPLFRCSSGKSNATTASSSLASKHIHDLCCFKTCRPFQGRTRKDALSARHVDFYTLGKKLEDPSAMPMSLPLDFLKSVTRDFSKEQELGRGGFGVVYKVCVCVCVLLFLLF
jgi:hypothetical protein